jgi:hypothetical protein
MIVDGLRCLISKKTYQGKPTCEIVRSVSLETIKKNTLLKYYPITGNLQYHIKHRPHVITKFRLDQTYAVKKLEHKGLLKFLHVYLGKNEKASIKFEKISMEDEDDIFTE